MTGIVVTISRKHQITLPAVVRRRLGVRAGDTIAFILDGDGVRIAPVRVTPADLDGSVPALPAESADAEREIDDAMAADADRLSGRLSGP